MDDRKHHVESWAAQDPDEWTGAFIDMTCPACLKRVNAHIRNTTRGLLTLACPHVECAHTWEEER